MYDQTEKSKQAPPVPVPFHPHGKPKHAFIFIRLDNHKKLTDQIDVWGGSAKLSPRIFCGIYTYHKNHDTKVKVRRRAGLLKQLATFYVASSMHSRAGKMTPSPPPPPPVMSPIPSESTASSTVRVTNAKNHCGGMSPLLWQRSACSVFGQFIW